MHERGLWGLWLKRKQALLPVQAGSVRPPSPAARAPLATSSGTPPHPPTTPVPTPTPTPTAPLLQVADPDMVGMMELFSNPDNQALLKAKMEELKEVLRGGCGGGAWRWAAAAGSGCWLACQARVPCVACREAPTAHLTHPLCHPRPPAHRRTRSSRT